jgi:D-threo-aldose 1-dehydrogenase
MALTPLPRRALGRTGLQVTPIGLGGAYLGYRREGDHFMTDEDLGTATVLRALELGINLIDTSAGYIGGSRSEEIIGLALERWFRAGGKREDLVISTKTGTRDRQNRGPHNYSAEATRESVETSLALLKCSYLDVVLVHDPDDLDPVLAPGGAWEALKTMKSQGLLRAMGLGVRSHAFHRRLIATGDCDVCLTYSDFNLANQSAASGVLEPATAANVGVLNGTSLFHGLLLGDRSPESVATQRAQQQWSPTLTESPEWRRAVAQAQHAWIAAQRYGVSFLALAIQFVVRDARVSANVLGASTPAQIEADIAALQTPIPDGIWAALADDSA